MKVSTAKSINTALIAVAAVIFAALTVAWIMQPNAILAIANGICALITVRTLLRRVVTPKAEN